MQTFCRTALVLATTFGLAGGAHAAIDVEDYGATAWETFNYTFAEDFQGLVTIGVSNYGDQGLDSNLLLDGLANWGPAGNTGFEMGDLTGYNVYGTAEVLSQTYASSGDEYLPVEGALMASLWSNGADTSAWGGTNGAYLSFEISASTGDSVSMSWAFLAHDYVPFKDFGFVSMDNNLTGLNEVVTLAQITIPAVPEPETYAMMLAGLGMLGWASRRRKQG